VKPAEIEFMSDHSSLSRLHAVPRYASQWLHSTLRSAYLCQWVTSNIRGRDSSSFVCPMYRVKNTSLHFMDWPLMLRLPTQALKLQCLKVYQQRLFPLQWRHQRTKQNCYASRSVIGNGNFVFKFATGARGTARVNTMYFRLIFPDSLNLK
jgi:hypothetical protein